MKLLLVFKSNRIFKTQLEIHVVSFVKKNQRNWHCVQGCVKEN